MIFTRTVSCTNEFAGDVPAVLVVEIDPALADRIRELAAAVRELKVYAIEEFDYHAAWYEADYEAEGADEDTPAPGEEYLSLDCETLHVSDDDFWWEAWLKGADVRVSCEPILISELV